MDLFSKKKKPRINCELCGRRLALPERDPTKIAICKKCLYGETK